MITSRYIQLVEGLPGGKFYESNGHIIPFRSSPYQFRFETITPSRTFGLYLNGQFLGTVSTDTNGIAIVTLTLPQGRGDISLLDGVTGQNFHAYVEVRKTATWHAAYADVIETLDASGEDVYNARQIQTCPSLYLEDTYGTTLNAPNTDNYSLRTYRNELEELRQAYRHFAGIDRGLRLGIEPITSVAPLRVPRPLIPDWIVGQQLSPNGRLQTKSRQAPALYQVAGQDLPNINVKSLSWITPAGIQDNNAFVIIVGNQPPYPQRLTATVNFAVWGGAALTIVGTSPTGQAIQESIVPVPIASLTSTNGTTQQVFATVTSITRATFGPSIALAEVGVADSRCIRVLSLGSYNVLASTALALTVATPNTLAWGTGSVVNLYLAATATKGTFTAVSNVGLSSQVYGRPIDPYNLQPVGTGFACDNVDQLFVWTEAFGTVRVDLSSIAGGAVTAANVIATFNAGIPGGYPIAAAAITGSEGVTGHIVRLLNSLTTIPNSILLLPGPSDATRQIFGLPTAQATLANSPAAGTRTIQLSAVDQARFPAPDNHGIACRYFTDPLILAGLTFGSVATATPLGLGTLQVVITLAAIPTALATYTSPRTGDVAGVSVDLLKTSTSIDGDGKRFLLHSSTTTDTLTVDLDLATFRPYLTASQTIGTANNIEIYSSTQYQIRLRGRRFAGTNGTIAVLANQLYATFVSGTATFVAGDVGSYVRISEAADSGNNGIHKITGFTNATTVTLLNDRAATNVVFVNHAGADLHYAMWSNGETHTVVAKSGANLTTRQTLVATWTSSLATWVDQTAALPAGHTVVDTSAGGTITVAYDSTFLPGGSQTDNITPTGGQIPDGWQINGNPTNDITASTRVFGLLGPSRTILRTNTASNDILFYRSIPGATAYKGYKLQANFWVQEFSNAAGGTFRVDVSMDGGVTWLLSSNITTDPLAYIYTGRVLDFSVLQGTLDPQVVTRIFWVLHTATDVWIRLVRVGQVATPLTIAVDLVTVEAQTHTGLFLGSNTIPRDQDRALFRELLYVWSAEALSASEDKTLGIPQLRSDGTLPAIPSRAGLIDFLSPAHEVVERFDVSEYDGSGNKINIVGCYSDSEWLAATLTNMELAPGTPARLSYVRPTRISQVLNENLSLTAGGGGSTSSALSITALFEGATPPGTPDGKSILYEIKADGSVIPIGDTPDFSAVQPWHWVVGNEIFIDQTYIGSTSFYQLSYPAMIRSETPATGTGAITLPTNRTDYVWYVDAAVWTRCDPQQFETARTVQLQFLGDFTAKLVDQSTQDQTQATLIQNNGSQTTSVAQADWQYVDGFTIKLNSAVFDPNALYTFTYEALTLRPTLPVTYRIDWKSGANPGALAAATYTLDVKNGDPITPTAVDGTIDQYHQLRITFFNCQDVRDFRAFSLGLRGVHANGTPYAPGLILNPI